jgi:hypothetical protein
MTIDERIERKLQASGHDLQTDEGARLFQQQLERELEQQKKQAAPPRKVERVRGIMI